MKGVYRRRLWRFCFFTLCVWLCVVVASCEVEGLAPPEQIQSLRVLAVRADPPDVAPNGEVRLSALVAAPGGIVDSEVRYQWYLCQKSSDINGGCAEANGAVALGQTPTVSAEIPKERFPKNASLLVRFRGVYVPVTLVVSYRGQQIIATKRIVLTALASNVNPKIAKLSLFREGSQQALPEPFRVKAGQRYRWEPTIDSTKVQDYLALNPNGELKSVKENLFFSWFSDSGRVNGRGSGAARPAKTWTAPTETGRSRLYIVLRDGRGGVDWLSREVIVE